MKSRILSSSPLSSFRTLTTKARNAARPLPRTLPRRPANARTLQVPSRLTCRRLSSGSRAGTPNPANSDSEQALDADGDAEYAPSEHDLRFGYYDIILPSEPVVWGTAHILPRPVPAHIPRPPYVPEHFGPGADEEMAVAEEDAETRRRKLVTGAEEVGRLRRAAQLAADVLKFAGTLVQAGRTTDEIDAAVHELVIACGAYPSPLLYKGFPKSCCTSVNNIVTHGIPDDRPLQDDDIVNIDITVYLDGFHGDTSKTFVVGPEVDDKGRELVQITEAALEAGIAACGPGKPFKGIGRAIHELLKGKDYSVSPQFSGHGIGREFHRQPWILHHLNDEPGEMQPGDCFTIEPAIIQGTDPHGWTFPDGWTVSTENCARAAQAEHMVYITDTGAEVLTRPSI
ncbi:methionine aminopeptidase [Trametes coccinea BRFM310]|uniref:Methionine aminopeptidase n=1 Tax=Trametes coccinea (strain BRFM310) TaxID=1353009 RepID=A0A1Y2IC09_TRAC3|nr:methionine aminopeptidase [Trametes coccinea BRFM310]